MTAFHYQNNNIKTATSDSQLAEHTKDLCQCSRCKIDRLTAENAELREAVKALLVHKVYWGCPWCLSYVDESNKIIHAPDCPRQRAAALVGEVEK